MNIKHLRKLLWAMAVAIAFASCSSTKDIAYFQNSENVDLSPSRTLYDAKIMPKDLLSITVTTADPQAAIAFNLTAPTVQTATLSTNSTQQATLITYLVDNEGYINFPKVGQLKLGGLTKREAEHLVLDKIRPYLSEYEEPIVTVRMANYKISVLGEVQRPGMYTVSNEKISILEALAQAGDLTIYGVRSNVKLVREDATGEKSIHVLDLNKADIINSPYYYLQQNDIVYVEPNKVKAQNSSVGSMTTLWFSATSILISMTSLLYNILKD